MASFVNELDGLLRLNPGDDEYDYWKAEAGKAMKKRLGVPPDPLNEVHVHVRLVTRTLSFNIQRTRPWIDLQGPTYVPVFPESGFDPVPNVRRKNRKTLLITYVTAYPVTQKFRSTRISTAQRPLKEIWERAPRGIRRKVSICSTARLVFQVIPFRFISYPASLTF